MEDYIKKNTDSDIADQVISYINNRYYKVKSFTWNLNYMNWFNIYCYSGEHYINFDDIKKKSLISICGPNHTGKSSIFDIMVLGIFGKTLRGVQKDIVYRTRYKIEKFGEIIIHLTIDGKPCVIERFFKKFKNRNKIIYNEENISQGKLEELIGSYKNFIYTYFKHQQSNSFIDLTNVEKNNIISIISENDSFRKIEKQVKNDIKVTEGALQTIELIPFEEYKEKLKKIETDLEEYKKKNEFKKEKLQKLIDNNSNLREPAEIKKELDEIEKLNIPTNIKFIKCDFYIKNNIIPKKISDFEKKNTYYNYLKKQKLCYKSRITKKTKEELIKINNYPEPKFANKKFIDAIIEKLDQKNEFEKIEFIKKIVKEEDYLNYLNYKKDLEICINNEKYEQLEILRKQIHSHNYALVLENNKLYDLYNKKQKLYLELIESEKNVKVKNNKKIDKLKKKCNTIEKNIELLIQSYKKVKLSLDNYPDNLAKHNKYKNKLEILKQVLNVLNNKKGWPRVLRNKINETIDKTLRKFLIKIKAGFEIEVASEDSLQITINGLSASLASGYQRFVIDIGLRLAWCKIKCGPKFLAIDEGFGALDKDNFGNLIKYFDKIKKKFDFVLIVNHQNWYGDENIYTNRKINYGEKNIKVYPQEFHWINVEDFIVLFAQLNIKILQI